MSRRVCKFDGCKRPASARGWCHTHYVRWWKHGDPSVVLSSGGRPTSPEGTRTLTTQSYVWVKATGHPEAKLRGWALEHRMVWHDEYGPIPPGYDVHHIDFDHAHNDPSNLMLLEHDGEHKREHAAIERCLASFRARRR